MGFMNENPDKERLIDHLKHRGPHIITDLLLSIYGERKGIYGVLFYEEFVYN